HNVACVSRSDARALLLKRDAFSTEDVENWQAHRSALDRLAARGESDVPYWREGARIGEWQ
ncbi:unnamed protein product, partial [Amoebophrya sp. A25]